MFLYLINIFTEMPLEIFLTEGPNVIGLAQDRVALYVGYCERGEDLAFCVIEGRKIGTPNSYKLHLGELGKPLEEANITRFEYVKQTTVVDFILKNVSGRLRISNTSDKARNIYGNLDEALENVYNFFGDGKTGMFPSDWKDYFLE